MDAKSYIYSFDSVGSEGPYLGQSGAIWTKNLTFQNGYLRGGPAILYDTLVDPAGNVLTANTIDGLHIHDTQYGATLATHTKAGIRFLCAYDNAASLFKMYASEEDLTFHNDVTGPVVADATDETKTIAIQKFGIQFASFGETVYATNPKEPLQYIDVQTYLGTTSTNFAAVSYHADSANVCPRLIVSHGGHLIAANIWLDATWNGMAQAEYPNLIWVSEFDDPEFFGSYTFTPSNKGTNFYYLYDTPGEITALASSGDYVFAFKDNSIYISDGPPFAFRLLHIGAGTIYPNSVFYYNGWVYFWSISGPARVNAGGDVQYLLKQNGMFIINSSGFHRGALTGQSNLGSEFIFEPDIAYPLARRVWGAWSTHGDYIIFLYKATSSEGSSRLIIIDPDTGIASFHLISPFVFTSVTQSGLYDASYLYAMKGTNSAFQWSSQTNYQGPLFVWGYDQDNPDECAFAGLFSAGGRNYTQNPAQILTKIFKPTKTFGVKTRIVAVRPLIAGGVDAADIYWKASIRTRSGQLQDTAPTGGWDETVSSFTNDGLIVFDKTIFGDDHQILLEESGRAGATAHGYSTNLNIDGIYGMEVFYEEQGLRSI